MNTKSLLYQLTQNIGHDEEVIFRSHKCGTQIRRVRKLSDGRLACAEVVIAKIEVEQGLIPDEFVASQLWDTAQKVRELQ